MLGEDKARHTIIIVEGPADVWAIGPGAVATCGLSYSKAQLLRMASHPVRCVCFDKEAAAQRRAEKLCGDLSIFPGETFQVQLSGKDAASSPKKEIKQLRKEFLE